MRDWKKYGTLFFCLVLLGGGQSWAQGDSSFLQTVNRFNIRFDVEMIPQTSNVSCWAAATAMIVGWRDWVVLRPEEIAEGTGYWAFYHNDRYRIDRELDPEDLNMFEVWGLIPETRRDFSLEDIADLLWNYGPLWVASDEDLTDSGRRYGHIRVVTGIRGDGTPQGTILYINDPWDRNRTQWRPSNRGSQYTEPFEEFIGKLRHLINRENNENAIYLAHP